LFYGRKNGVSTTLKIYSPSISRHCESQAASLKSRITDHKTSTLIDLIPIRASIANYESRVTSHKSRNPDEL
jgi:hypothetical protein